MKLLSTITFIFAILLLPKLAQADLDYLCKKLKLDACEKRRYSKTGGTSIPSESSSYRINPSSIPVEKGIGGEVITASGMYDYGIVTGTGKIGAAVSPTSMQDTFFSNISIENPTEYIERKRRREEYKSQKITLAGGTRIFAKKIKLLTPSIGVIAKYGNDSKKIHPGAGVSVNFGPINLGYSVNKDDYHETLSNTTYEYTTTNTTFGVKFPYLAVDYSKVKNKNLANLNDTEVNILSMTFFWRDFMLTYASRKEISFRPQYDFELDTVNFIDEKREVFNGIQYTIKKRYIVGLFYNYFLNREYSVGLTVFF